MRTSIGTAGAYVNVVLFDDLPAPIFTPPPPAFAPDLPEVMPECEGFELIRVLGAGAMAVVYEARPRAGGDHVALKVLREEYAVDPECVLRFEREVRIAERIQSRHVPKVLGLIRTQEGLPCMLMERLVGKNLSKVLQERGPLPVTETVECMMQICAALASAHAVGVVHRDLKPSNIFFAEEAGGVVIKVMDFGLSKLEGDMELTGVHATFGTPKFMSPEQIRSPKLADRRSDLWALGVTLYLMLSGRYPFPDKGYAAVLNAIANTEPPHLADIVPGLDRLLATVVMNLLKKDPALRYQDVNELTSALERFLQVSVRIDNVDSLTLLEDPDADDSLQFLPTVPAPSSVPPASSAAPPTPRHYAVIPTPTNASRMNWALPGAASISVVPPAAPIRDIDEEWAARMRPPRWHVPVVLAAIAVTLGGAALVATRTEPRAAALPHLPADAFVTHEASAPVAPQATPQISPSAVPTATAAPSSTVTPARASAKERAFFSHKPLPR